MKLEDISLCEDSFADAKLSGYHPPAGTFTKSASDIAKQLKKDADSKKQAISRAVWYFNRRKQSAANTSKRNAVVKALHQLYGSK